jgi:pyridinium-3,5-bisthiocarboxylic acid mononucleotide nickel chelatase
MVRVPAPPGKWLPIRVKAMRAGYLDCASGASGDMLLGALIGAGWPEEGLRAVVAALGVPLRLLVSRVDRHGSPALRVEVHEDEPPAERPYTRLAEILDASGIDRDVREAAQLVLRRLADVESAVHAVPIERVHLHELGGLDTLVDVVGVLAGVRALGIERVTASPVNIGRGWVTIGHGTVPVPAPATSVIIEGMPVYANDIEGELLTPTGAALLSALVGGWGSLPRMRLERVGAGAGRMDLPRANVLRLFVGEAIDDAPGAEPSRSMAAPSPDVIGPAVPRSERLLMLEASIDDMNPQLYPHVMQRLIDAGALDVMVIPALMKKGRPGHLLRVLAVPSGAQTLEQILLTETTTLGLRVYETTRHASGRRMADVETEFGRIRVKIAEDVSGALWPHPEFEDCRAAAERHGVPVRRVMAAAQRASLEALEPRPGS